MELKMEDTTRTYEFERRLGTAEKDIQINNINILNLKQEFKDENIEMKSAIKELSVSNAISTKSILKIEANSTALINIIKLLCLLASVFWGYSNYVDTHKVEVTSIFHQK
jgi:hypothetical protein